MAGTQATLKAATALAHDLGARITILVAQVVPYPLDLRCPPVPVEFTEQALCTMAADQDVETTIKLYLCRDRQRTVRQALKPDSMVVIEGRQGWWPTADKRLARMLRRDGHHVMIVDPREPSPVEAALEKVEQ